MNNQDETGGGLLPVKNGERKVVGSGDGFGVCPTCGKRLIMEKFQKQYWRVRCIESHFTPIAGHPMKTKKAAIAAWITEHGKPNGQISQRGQ